MDQQARGHRFNVEAVSMVFWTLFAVVVCYGTSVWTAVALIEHSPTFAALGGNLYALATVLSVVIAFAILLGLRAGRRSRLTLPRVMHR